MRQARCKLLKMGWGRREREKNGVGKNGEVVEIDQAERREEKRGENSRTDAASRHAGGVKGGTRWTHV